MIDPTMQQATWGVLGMYEHGVPGVHCWCLPAGGLPQLWEEEPTDFRGPPRLQRHKGRPIGDWYLPGRPIFKCGRRREDLGFFWEHRASWRN